MALASPLSPQELAYVLPEMVARELGTWREAFAGETMRAFDLGCFPWHGYLELSFLTTDEPNIPVGVRPFSAIAHWRLYNFGVRSSPHLRNAREELGMRMYSYWSASSNFGETSESFFRSAVAVVSSPVVKEALSLFLQSADFQVTVFDHDHSERGNLAASGGEAEQNDGADREP